MNKLTFQKKQWMTPLQMLVGAVDKKQLQPILSTILVRFSTQSMMLTATDLEIELTATVDFPTDSPPPAFTVPAKKLFDLIKTLEDDAIIEIQLEKQHLLIHSPPTQFKLFTLPPEQFPLIDPPPHTAQIVLPRLPFIHLLQSTAFSISQQDVRVFLNGMLLELDYNRLTSVSADGHRLSIATLHQPHDMPLTKLILPKKSVAELLRILSAIQDEDLQLYFYNRLFQVKTHDYLFSSQLIDSSFLPYQQVIPKGLNTFVLLDQSNLKRALSRILIIASDKARPVILEASHEALTLFAQNKDHEQVVERLEATLDGQPIRIGMNPYYLLEVLSIFPEGLVRLSFSSPDTSLLVESLQDEHYQYILMPMKI